MSDWKKIEPVNSNATPWDYRNETIKEFQGIFTGQRIAKLKDGSEVPVYEFEYTGSDSKFPAHSAMMIWGNVSVLDTRLKNVKEGEEVKIVYLGKEQGKAGRTFHNFDIYHRTPGGESVKEEVDLSDVPF